MLETDEVMLTTVDNPFNPFTDFDAWYNFDVRNHYDCCGLIDRFTKVDNKMNEIEIKEATIDAMNRIIDLHPQLYMKVHKNDRRYSGNFDFSKEVEGLKA